MKSATAIMWLLPMLYGPIHAAGSSLPLPINSHDGQQPIVPDTVHSASHNLGEAVVSGLAGKVALRNNPAPVSLISHRDLMARMGGNLIDAVAKEPGVSQISTGPGISKPVIRGLGYNRVVVVNNGLRQEEQQWGDEHGVGIDANSVGSVEIVKGPASVMYGSDAMAGVLVFHPSPIPAEGQLSGDASMEYQTNSGLFNLSAGASGRSGSVFYGLRASGDMAHDYRVPSAGLVPGSSFRQWAATGMLGIVRSWGTSRLNVSHVHFKPGIVEGESDEERGNGYSLPLPFQRIAHTSVSSDNRIRLGSTDLQVLAGYQQNDRGEYEEIATAPGLHLLLRTLNYNVNWQSLDLWGQSKLRLGVSGMWQRSVNEGDEFLIPDYNLFDIGGFAAIQHDTSWGSLSAGLRYDHRHINSHQLYDEGEERFAAFQRSFNALSGSVGAVVHAGDQGQLRINVSRGFRSPNLGELASNGVHEGTQHYEQGNQQLKAEHSLQGDLGYEYLGTIVHASASLFINDVQNYIFLQRTSGAAIDGVPVYNFVQGHARLWGAEAVLDIHPVRHLHIENTFSLVKSYLLHQQPGADHLPFTPAPRLRSEVRYDILHNNEPARFGFENLWAGINLDCNWRQRDCFTINETETPTAGYVLLGASIGADISIKGRRLFSLYVNGENLTNKRYFSHLSRLKYAGDGVYNPGRNVGVKLIYYFGN